jgi:ParB family chromosome partitioning protein
MPSNRLFDLFTNKDADKAKVISIPIDQIEPSRYQPRIHFDEEALQELAESIQENGLIQPITVRKLEDHYEIIAGERRYRACRMAGYQEITCYVLNPDEDHAAQMALVENVQRQNLSAIEEAKSYVQIMRQAGLTQEEVARRIGKSQSAVANKIRLLNLPNEVQDGVVAGKITERHARALLSVPDEERRNVYHEILKKNFNVRETEQYIEKMQKPKKVHKRQKTTGFSRQTQIAVNTIEQAVKMVKKLGIDATLDTKEDDGSVTMTVRFPKG